jgi:hypothetical protein
MYTDFITKEYVRKTSNNCPLISRFPRNTHRQYLLLIAKNSLNYHSVSESLYVHNRSLQPLKITLRTAACLLYRRFDA